jgi:hypothetical protein
VAVVPLVSPLKKASAIWQKKGLDITSVKGRVTIAPPQVPVSAGNRVDVSTKTTIVIAKSDAERSFSFMVSLRLLRFSDRSLGGHNKFGKSWSGQKPTSEPMTRH